MSLTLTAKNKPARHRIALKTPANEKTKIAILGFGREGRAVLNYLKKSPLYKNSAITIRDEKINKFGGINSFQKLEQFNIIFRSPGVPYNRPEIKKALKKGALTSSATKLFFQDAKKIGCQIIGVTGSKGKSTTATLIYKILQLCKKDVYLAGNIGRSALEILLKLQKNSIAILELSSFQLQDLTDSPQIAVILPITPEHLDHHKNFNEYLQAKTNIAKYQKLNDKVFYLNNDKFSSREARKSRGKKIAVSKKEITMMKNKINLPGWHNLQNAALASAVAKSLACPQNKITEIFKKFRGLKHRLEPVSFKKDGIKFYNDSASSNPYATIAALKAFNAPKILIAGGQDKNLNYAPLAQSLKKSNTQLVILYGANKNKIKKAIFNAGVPIKLTDGLETAVARAYKKAKTYNPEPKSLIVIFSPGSASFDMFKNYKERGEKFKKIVKLLK